jgi:hypothetical protein
LVAVEPGDAGDRTVQQHTAMLIANLRLLIHQVRPTLPYRPQKLGEPLWDLYITGTLFFPSTPHASTPDVVMKPPLLGHKPAILAYSGQESRLCVQI